jgi:hypothetical protein
LAGIAAILLLLLVGPLLLPALSYPLGGGSDGGSSQPNSNGRNVCGCIQAETACSSCQCLAAVTGDTVKTSELANWVPP